jgi:hypothetical protein
MGIKEMASSATLPSESAIKIIEIKGKDLPKNYQGVVIARWLNSLRKYNKFFKTAEQDGYYKVYEPFIKLVLLRPEVKIRLAALEEDHDVVFGWSVYEGDLLHYVHVQAPYNRLGISYDLIPKEIKAYSHTTGPWEEYYVKKPRFKKLKFNPFFY